VDEDLAVESASFGLAKGRCFEVGSHELLCGRTHHNIGFENFGERFEARSEIHRFANDGIFETVRSADIAAVRTPVCRPMPMRSSGQCCGRWALS